MALDESLISPTSAPNHIGPHASYIQVAKPFMFEQQINDSMGSARVSQVKEDGFRLQGVAWIDSVRNSLQLPVRTFDTAVAYYHKFRLAHPDNDYSYADAAAAALFTACKIEDTLKKSKDILCSSYNMKLPQAEQLSSDDQVFEGHAKAIIGLERLMLEASGFDFRARHPQKLLVKLAKDYNVDPDTVGQAACDISIDLYRTFIPLKQSSFTMAIACLELAARIHEVDLPDIFGEGGVDYDRWCSSREEVMALICFSETLLDLLDLYTHSRTSTNLGQQHQLDAFLAIRIALNQESSAHHYPRHTAWTRKRKNMTNGASSHDGYRGTDTSPKSRRGAADEKLSPASHSPTSATGSRPRTGERGRDGTVRFMLEPDRAHSEKTKVSEYFKIEREEIEVYDDEDD